MTASKKNSPALTESKLRLEFIHKSTKSIRVYKKHPYPVQNIPFEYGIRATNIGSIVFQGAVVKDFKMDLSAAKVCTMSIAEPQIKVLNPGESTEVYFDKYTSPHEGSVWITCDLLPLKKGHIIKTFQFDTNHNMDSPTPKNNSWSNSSFIQGQMELLQIRTNALILVLTAITVLEAIFGLEEIFKNISQLLSFCFALLSDFFYTIAV
jgi:hypothetical protein